MFCHQKQGCSNGKSAKTLLFVNKRAIKRCISDIDISNRYIILVEISHHCMQNTPSVYNAYQVVEHPEHKTPPAKSVPGMLKCGLEISTKHVHALHDSKKPRCTSLNILWTSINPVIDFISNQSSRLWQFWKLEEFQKRKHEKLGRFTGYIINITYVQRILYFCTYTSICRYT